MRRLESLGYVGGIEEAPEESDVLIYDQEACWNGVNLVSSSHGREAYLMDMEGETLPTWRYEQEGTSDHKKIPALIFKHWYFRKALPPPNGDLVAQRRISDTARREDARERKPDVVRQHRVQQSVGGA